MEWRLFATVWLVYLIHLAPLTGYNENRYLDLVRSIVDEGRFEIDTYHFNTGDKSYRNGHYYAGAAPGPAFLAIPGYLAFKVIEPILPESLFRSYDKPGYIRGFLKSRDAPDNFVDEYPIGRFIISHLLITALSCCLLTAITVVVLYRTALNFISRSDAMVVALTYAFGTLTFFYATRLYAHVLGGGFVFLAFMILAGRYLSNTRITPTAIFWSGLCLGTAVLMDYAAAPVATCVGIYILVKVRDQRIVWAVLGGLIPVGILLWYHYVCFGSPFKTAYGFPNGPVDDGIHKYYEQNFHGFSLPDPTHLWGITLGMFDGLLWHMPIIIPAGYGLVAAILNDNRFRIEWTLIAGTVLAQCMFNAMMHPLYWFGGWNFGPRFTQPMMPFLMLGLIPIMTMVRIRHTIILPIAILSILICWIGVQYGPSESLPGVFILFLLSGPALPVYTFIETYIHSETAWPIGMSPTGIFLIFGLIIGYIWYTLLVPKLKS